MSVLNTLANKMDASPHIVGDWRDVHTTTKVKWYSVGALINIILASATQAFLAVPLYSILPIRVLCIVMAVMFLLGIAGKYLVKDLDGS